MGLTIVFHIVTVALGVLIHSLWEAAVKETQTTCLRLKRSNKMDSHCIYNFMHAPV